MVTGGLVGLRVGSALGPVGAIGGAVYGSRAGAKAGAATFTKIGRALPEITRTASSAARAGFNAAVVGSVRIYETGRQLASQAGRAAWGALKYMAGF
jgi:hypothetical protein